MGRFKKCIFCRVEAEPSSGVDSFILKHKGSCAIIKEGYTQGVMMAIEAAKDSLLECHEVIPSAHVREALAGWIENQIKVRMPSTGDYE